VLKVSRRSGVKAWSTPHRNESWSSPLRRSINRLPGDKSDPAPVPLPLAARQTVEGLIALAVQPPPPDQLIGVDWMIGEPANSSIASANRSWPGSAESCNCEPIRCRNSIGLTKVLHRDDAVHIPDSTRRGATCQRRSPPSPQSYGMTPSRHVGPAVQGLPARAPRPYEVFGRPTDYRSERPFA